MKSLILFLIRKRLGLKLNEAFRFKNQRSKHDYYFFERDQLTKGVYHPKTSKWFSLCYTFEPSHVSINWILNDSCKIIRYHTTDTIPEPMKDRK